MFREPPVWDKRKLYYPTNLDVYFNFSKGKQNNLTESWLVKGDELYKKKTNYCGINFSFLFVGNPSLVKLLMAPTHPPVDPMAPLGRVLQHENFTVRGGIPQFFVLPKDSPYRSLYFSRFNGVR